jgi:hypothetical protein
VIIAGISTGSITETVDDRLRDGRGRPGLPAPDEGEARMSIPESFASLLLTVGEKVTSEPVSKPPRLRRSHPGRRPRASRSSRSTRPEDLEGLDALDTYPG